MAEARDWLILSMKWSNNEWLFKWYDTGMCGYTSSLLRAGRYTEAEARGEQRRVPHCLLAVKLDWVVDFYQPDLVLRNEGKTRERLELESKLWAAKHPLDPPEVKTDERQTATRVVREEAPVSRPDVE